MSAIIKKAGTVCDAFEFVARPYYENTKDTTKKPKSRTYGPLVIPAENLLIINVGENVQSYVVHCSDTLGHLMHYMSGTKVVIDNCAHEKREVSLSVVEL